MKPIAVLISDLHFTPSTLELASQAFSMAAAEAKLLDVPFIIAGDTLDSKAIIRGECANRLISLMEYHAPGIDTYIMVGNHDRLNEKAPAHTLNFLRPYCTVVDEPTPLVNDLLLVPYYSDLDELRELISYLGPGSGTWIMHQGLKGAHMGEYIIDNSSIEPEAFDGLRVISGHYHRAQDIKCGQTGLWSYIGTPYTTSFAEAGDGPKGFRVLYDDGTLELIPTNLRKHVILSYEIGQILEKPPQLLPEDLVWVKVSGPQTELDKLDKKSLGHMLLGHENFKLDKVYTDVASPKEPTEGLDSGTILDNIIDRANETKEQKQVLKRLWREVLS